MLNHLETANIVLVEAAIAIFNALDEGEFHQANDAAHVDPVKNYTTPQLQAVLAEGCMPRMTR